MLCSSFSLRENAIPVKPDHCRSATASALQPLGEILKSLQGLVIGVIAGFGGGFISLGGGTLAIPLLMGWANLTPFQARGTALATALFSATMGTWVYSEDKQVDWATVWLVALPALFVAPLTASLTERFHSGWLRRLFGLVIVFGAVTLLLRDELPSLVLITDSFRVPYLLGVGIVEGLVAGSVGVSGGPILAPLLALGLGMPQQLAQGCSLAARLPAVAGSLAENIGHHHISWPLIPGLAAGSVAASWLGGRTALALPEQHLRQIFSLVLLLLGLYYLRGRPAPSSPAT
jgi:uncharacterized membrane protein YfcA